MAKRRKKKVNKGNKIGRLRKQKKEITAEIEKLERRFNEV